MSLLSIYPLGRRLLVVEESIDFALDLLRKRWYLIRFVPCGSSSFAVSPVVFMEL